jgi:hypothetical protein
MKRVLADSVTDIFGTIAPPNEVAQLGTGKEGINNLLGNIVGLFFSAGAIAFILMFVWGAVQMILSGGDKEAIAKGRSKITWAIVGVVLMSLSYFIFQLLEALTGFKFFAP